MGLFGKKEEHSKKEIEQALVLLENKKKEDKKIESEELIEEEFEAIEDQQEEKKIDNSSDFLEKITKFIEDSLQSGQNIQEISCDLFYIHSQLQEKMYENAE